ncbi:MAG: outer membrane lipoprotein-sorting protein [Candidatus Sulfotelmatobacter sp.]
MKRTLMPSLGVLGLILLSSLAQAQTLESVLKKMDTTAANFRTAEANFVWQQYQRVVQETDTQSGTVYYRKSADDIEMVAEVKQPDHKVVLYKDGKLQVYQPNINQVMEYSTGANRGDLESYLVLGFGGSGQDLVKSFDVTYVGEENVDGKPTAKLQLIPKSDKVRNTFPKIFLWIDLGRGVSLQQKFMQTQGDWRTATYSDIRIPAKIGNDVFELKTNKKTTFVSPRG